jgi:hypothetical protein
MNKEKKQSCERCGSRDGIDIYFGSTQKEIWLCKACRKQLLLGR